MDDYVPIDKGGSPVALNVLMGHIADSEVTVTEKCTSDPQWTSSSSSSLCSI